MDPNGHIYYDPDGSVPEEDAKRLEEALLKAPQAERDRIKADMAAAREAFEALRDA